MEAENAKRIYENQEQIQTVPSFNDHIIIENLTLIQVHSPNAGVGPQFFVDRILRVFFFKVKLA